MNISQCSSSKTTCIVEQKRNANAQLIAHFRSEHYLRINHRRLEHLATLNLPIRGRHVLELGAGIGDLTNYFLDRDCEVTAIEGRAENVNLFKERFDDNTKVNIHQADLDNPPSFDGQTWPIIFAYGLLYHLSNPTQLIDWMASHCSELIILSTCVTPNSDTTINPLHEDATASSQAISGTGCRPTRQWVFNQLRRVMPHVYATVTQPAHDEFPLDWSNVSPSATGLARAVFVASRIPLDTNTPLTQALPIRHDPAN